MRNQAYTIPIESSHPPHGAPSQLHNAMHPYLEPAAHDHCYGPYTLMNPWEPVVKWWSRFLSPRKTCKWGWNVYSKRPPEGMIRVRYEYPL